MTDKKIKLSPKQKEVIELMRRGEILRHMKYTGYSAISIGSIISPFVNKHSFKSLREKGLIIFSNKNAGTSFYVLTELGKTIQL